ncbi:MAG: hypothetical protein HY867_10505 [Chloroflexi bacterium]|nr:hypothetical protein [Chloroflexota bacterium]
MDKFFFRRQESTQQPTAGLQIFRGILKWLADIFHFTEEEKMDAGIYLREKRNK